MNIIKRYFIFLLLMMGLNSFAQQTLPEGQASVSIKKKKPVAGDDIYSKFSISAGVGIANYFGDLMQYNRYFSQPGFSFSAGASYAFSNKFGARFNAGIQKVKAADSKNNGTQYKERNLSFSSNVFDLSLSLDYFLLNMKKHGFSPYLSAGIGAMFFNPYTKDIAGKKQYLRELGTEGQGLLGYPGMYSKTAVQIPLGFGVKIAAGKNTMLLFDFNYRFTGTDYLDDVSTNGYPPKALLDARNPLTSKFTWRGNEVGGGAYPANLKLPRGNPNNKDGYYTTQFKVAYTFNKKARPVKDVVTVPMNKISTKDSDGDSVTDAFDKCPLIKGSAENSGCPLPFIEGAELVNISADSMTYSIYFDLDRSILLPDAYKILKRIVQILETDNSLSINITGHSDNLGTSLANMNLSAERANIVKDYFLSYHIAASRINSSYYGETRPADTNQQWRNRRVEITIIKN